MRESFLSKVVRVLVLSLCLICMSAIASASSFRLGDQGAEIAEIQAALASQGYDVTADGDFGPATQAAVAAFQSANGLDNDGLVGAMTYQALMGRNMPVVSRSSNYIAKRIINSSLNYIGVPYVFGGTTQAVLIVLVLRVMFLLQRVFLFHVQQMYNLK